MTEPLAADDSRTLREAEIELASEPELTLYSKDYWDLVFEQLKKRWLFKVGMVILAVLYAVAIYAPLLANDRPFKLSAIDYKGYATAVRTLSAVSSSIARLLGQTAGEYAAERSENAPKTFALALDVERARREAQALVALGTEHQRLAMGDVDLRLLRHLAVGEGGEDAVVVDEAVLEDLDEAGAVVGVGALEYGLQMALVGIHRARDETAACTQAQLARQHRSVQRSVGRRRRERAAPRSR